MKIEIASLLISALFMAGSAFAQSGRLEVPTEKTGAFIEQFEAQNEANQKDWREFVNSMTERDDENLIVNWIQPFNKKISCKLWATVAKGQTPWWENTENRVYWDGDCRHGYAYGIGREFLVVKGEVASWLGEYDGEQKRPTYHLMVHYDRQFVEFLAASPPYHARWTYSVQQGPNGKRMTMVQALMNLTDERVYTKNVEIGGDQFTKAMALPNKNKYWITYNVNPAGSFVFHAPSNGSNTGYSIGFLDNGISRQIRQLHQLSNTRSEEVSLPESYRNHLAGVENKIDTNLGVGEKLIQESYVAISKYKRRICKGDVRAGFVDDEIYARICLENGELGPFAGLIADSLGQQEKRHVKAREDIARQKEQIALLQATQLEQQRRNQEIARPQTNQTDTTLSQAVSEFGKAMANLHQNSANFTSSFMNSLPSQAPTFGNPATSRTNCVLVANIVRCKTQ